MTIYHSSCGRFTWWGAVNLPASDLHCDECFHSCGFDFNSNENVVHHCSVFHEHGLISSDASLGYRAKLCGKD